MGEWGSVGAGESIQGSQIEINIEGVLFSIEHIFVPKLISK